MKYIESRFWALTLFIISMVLPSAARAEGEHQLTVVAKPAMAGTFNMNAAELVAGDSIHLYAYANNSFTFVQWTDESGAVVSKQMDFIYTMPTHDCQLTAEYEYNPSNPQNPVNNYWNKELGEVIIDNFTTGRLQNAVATVINGSDRSEVTMMTVAGVMNDNDFGIANNFSNCTLLDLSRVTGITVVPSYAFDYTNLETVYLPATIEKIGYRAFYECKQLSSLVVYAMMPPELENQVFTNVPEGLVVYVPASSITQYQDAVGWKDFTILPIQEDIRSISISLPNGTSGQDYAKMWLELTNTKSGQRMHYVMTDRSQYTFANIIRNTTWNVTLRNERGDVFGQIDNVEVKDEDVSVTFTSLSKPQSVALTVMTPDGQNVTSQTQITWMDASGNYLAQGTSLTGLPVGCQTSYRMALPQDLAMVYMTPQQVDYVLTDGNNNITCQLSPIPQVQISGKVKDASTGLPLSGATISASQTFGGKYSKTLNIKTDGNGSFTMEIANVPTSLAFAASDYVSQSRNYSDNELHELNELEDVLLKSISGATISLDFTYTTCDGETEEWYSDYNNVGYTLYNKTKQRTISQYNVQYPQIVLLEDVDDGDVLQLTASSRTNAFMPVEATATIAEQKASATFAIVELGKIHSSFTTTGNASVVGSLYDASGKLVKTYNYSNASLTINDLADGQYTLVSMGSSRLFNTIYDLAQLPQTGLSEGADYVQNTVEVKSGVISQVNIANVPKLDESKLYYTGENTSFTVNKPSIVAGNYLTLTARIDFKPAYATSVSNVNLIVDLPESCSFVENSVMMGNSTSSYTLNGNRITIPMARYTDRVRFCIIPTLGGEYAPSAFAQFDLNGETVTQPIGSANYTAKDLSISVPSTVAKKTIPISGTAIGTSTIDIYDNDVLIGQTTSLANGTWATTCELNEPYNLSTHSIYAKVTTKAGLELQSETVECQYDMNAIEVKTVTMINTAHPATSLNTCEYVTVFDFQNNTTSATSYNYWPSYPDFTFLVDFTNNDTAIVKNVFVNVFTDHNEVKQLKATYNGKMDKWVAVSKFTSNNLPINVSVNYDAQTEFLIDKDLMDEAIFYTHNEAIKYETERAILDSLLYSYDAELGQLTPNRERLLSISHQMFQLLNIVYPIDSLDEAPTSKEIEELLRIGEELLNEDDGDAIDAFIHYEDFIRDSLAIFSNGLTIKDCDSLSIEGIIEEGYEEFKQTDGSIVYILTTESHFSYVDFSRNICIDYKFAEDSIEIAASRRASETVDQKVERFCATLEKWANRAKTVVGGISSAINLVAEHFAKKAAKYEKQLADLQAQMEFYLLEEYYSPELEKLAKQQGKILRKYQTNKAIQENIAKITRYTSISKTLGRGFTLFDIAYNIYSFIRELRELNNVRHTIPDPCRGDQIEANSIDGYLTKWIGTSGRFYAALSASSVASLITAETGLFGAVATGGGTLVAVGVAIGLALGNVIAGIVYENKYEKAISNAKARISALQCDKSPDTPPSKSSQPQTPPVPPIHDPSGFVYEGVASNRIEGVTATAYYKEMVEDMYGDLHENIVKWDASEYAQENPLFTDENGMYAWDVPQGLWQVKFEKEGYETAYSEWLPVPPPQLDVNIAMKQNKQPEVKLARAFEDAVELEFDKYMLPELLTTENIVVIQNDKTVEGAVQLLNEEVSYEGGTETFASKVRFNAAQPFTEQEITLMVSNRVKSYAGIRMQDDYQQTFTIEQEIKQIASDSLITVGYGNTTTCVVSVLPASASKGKVLTVKTSSPMILGVEKELVTIGNDGKAEITVSGELPGIAALTFSVEGTDKMATTIANVEQTILKTVATPMTNIASGSVVEKGTAITLSCATEGATIYYTLDGSCPCDETGSRKKYDGTPIIIDESVVIKVIAIAPDMTESDVAEFVYIVDGSDGIDEVSTDGLKVILSPLPIEDWLYVNGNFGKIQQVEVYDMRGVKRLHKTGILPGQGVYTGVLPTGLYYITVDTDKGVFRTKVLKR